VFVRCEDVIECQAVTVVLSSLKHCSAATFVAGNSKTFQQTLDSLDNGSCAGTAATYITCTPIHRTPVRCGDNIECQAVTVVLSSLKHRSAATFVAGTGKTFQQTLDSLDYGSCAD